MGQQPEPEVGGVYRVYSRNLRVAVYVGDGLFIGIREKFGSRFLDLEGFDGPGFVKLGYWCPETPASFGGEREWVDSTEPIARVADDVPLTESGEPPSVCASCGRRAWWLGPPAPASWACEGGCDETAPRYNSNTALFEALDAIERSLGTRDEPLI